MGPSFSLYYFCIHTYCLIEKEGDFIMTQGIETMRIISVALYQYYLSYKRLSLEINQDVCDGFFNALINGFQLKCDYYDLTNPDNVLDSFLLFEEPFDDLIQFENIQNGYSYLMDQLIRFPKEHYLTIHDGYQILSILPIPFDSFDITHGMIVNYFTPILNTV